MATRNRTKGGGSQAFSIAVEADGIKATISSFNKLRLTEQLVAYRKASNKSVRAVKRTMKSLVPLGPGLRPDGQKRQHLRDSLTFNVKTLGRGDSRVISGIVGADYDKVPTIHLVNNPVKPHKITSKKTLSNLKIVGNKANATIFGRVVQHPGFRGLGFMQESANANEKAIRDFYVQAIREAVSKSIARSGK